MSSISGVGVACIGLVLMAGCSSDPVAATSADSARALRAQCGGSTLALQVTAAQVVAACGPPTFRDVWGNAPADPGPDLAPVEEWYYNPGAHGSVQVLRFFQGHLIAMSTDGVGFDTTLAPGSCATVAPGLSKYRLVLACGQPVTRQVYVLDPALAVPSAPVFSQGNALIEGGSSKARAVYREDLSFSLDGAVKTVTLQNGRVLQVDGSPQIPGKY